MLYRTQISPPKRQNIDMRHATWDLRQATCDMPHVHPLQIHIRIQAAGQRLIRAESIKKLHSDDIQL